MKQLWLHLDDLNEEFPSTKYDIGGMGHHIVINAEDKEKVLDEMAFNYRKELEKMFHEEEEDDIVSEN